MEPGQIVHCLMMAGIQGQATPQRHTGVLLPAKPAVSQRGEEMVGVVVGRLGDQSLDLGERRLGGFALNEAVQPDAPRGCVPGVDPKRALGGKQGVLLVPQREIGRCQRTMGGRIGRVEIEGAPIKRQGEIGAPGPAVQKGEIGQTADMLRTGFDGSDEGLDRRGRAVFLRLDDPQDVPDVGVRPPVRDRRLAGPARSSPVALLQGGEGLRAFRRRHGSAGTCRAGRASNRDPAPAAAAGHPARADRHRRRDRRDSRRIPDRSGSRPHGPRAVGA